MSKADKILAASKSLGSDRLSELRARAAEKFLAGGFPTTRMEDWKYTDLSLAQEICDSALEQPAETAASPVELPDIDAHWLVIRNGMPDVQSLPDLDGVQIRLLSESELDLEFELPLADFNLAMLSDGLSVRVSKQASLDKPLGLAFVDDADKGSLVSQGRVAIHIEEGAAAQIVEFHATRGDAEKYANIFVDLDMGKAARVDYARLQSRQSSAVQTAHLHVVADRDSTLRHFSLDLGGRLVRNDLLIDIDHPGADVEFNGLYLADDGQHIDNHTRVDHRVGPANSRQEYRGIVSGRAVWNGKAIVHKGADGTDAQQANHNLLVSERAEVDAKPELEIYAEDVKCSHGTTVGQLDEDAVFYLRTRCLSNDQAEQLMTRAFAMGVVERCPIQQCAEWISSSVDRALDSLIARKRN
jgi:Fe-S cluster assembly protein SufD